METFEDYLGMVGRQKWWIIVPFLLVILAGLAFGLSREKLYEAKTLILVQSQTFPEDFVRPVVSSDIDAGLEVVTQQIISRTNLEKIVQKYDIYRGSESKLSLQSKVQLMRRSIKIDNGDRAHRKGINSFSISFQYKDPIKVRDVTNALASNFIEENLKSRASQAIGTSGFITHELESVKRQLEEKEEELKNYRERYMGGLPEQLESNLKTLERLQGNLDQLHSNLRSAENKRIVLQAEIAEQEKTRARLAALSVSQAQRQRDLPSLKNELAFLESKFSQRHPDVIHLKNVISELEAEKSKNASDPAEEEIAIAGVNQTLATQFQEVEFGIKDLRAEIPKIRLQIKLLQTKVEDTPKREQELLALNRDYENLKLIYNSLLQSKLEAKIAVSMVRKQKGEQFRVISPAEIPIAPLKPNLPKIMLLTLFLGFGVGSGLAFLIDIMDKSYKTLKEVEKELKPPILISMPLNYSKKRLVWTEVKKALAVTSIAVGFVLSVAGIVLAVKGTGWTLSFVKDCVTNIESNVPFTIMKLFN